MAHAFICYHKTHYIFSPLITFDLKPRMSFYSWALRKANECDRGTKRYFCSSNCEHGELIEIQPSAKHIITDCLRRSKHHSNQFITVAGVSHNQTRAPSWRIDLRWFFFPIFVVVFVGKDDYVLLIRFCDSSANGIGSDRFNFFDMKCPVGFVTE